MRTHFLIAIIMVGAFNEAISQSGFQTEIFRVQSVDNEPITYEVKGEGETTLIFVHGWSSNRSYWKSQMQHFAEEYKVVAVDLVGHGDSGLGRNDYTIYSFGSDVARVVKEMDLTRVILIGHSMGGDVIVDAARELPGRVLGLVMVDTYKKLSEGRQIEHIEEFLNSLQPNFKDSVSAFVRDMFLPDSDPELIEYLTRDISSAPPEIAINSLRSSFKHSRQITHDLEALNLPVVALNPDDTPTDTDSMKKHGVETVIMPKAGHFLMMEDPQRFNLLLKKIVQKMDK